MASNKKTNPADDLMASLLKEVGMDESDLAESLAVDEENKEDFEPLELGIIQDEKADGKSGQGFLMSSDNEFTSNTSMEYEKSAVASLPDVPLEGLELTNKVSIDDLEMDLDLSLDGFDSADVSKDAPTEIAPSPLLSQPAEEAVPVQAPKPASPGPSMSLFGDSEPPPSTPSLFGDSAPEDNNRTQVMAPSAKVSAAAAMPAREESQLNNNDKTVALGQNPAAASAPTSAASPKKEYNPNENTVAVTGFQVREIETHEDKVKVSIGQSRSMHSPGYAAWGSSESSLGQAENLRIAQEKILDLEKENEKLRMQNEELMSASEIIKERSDLLTAQITEYKNDKDNLEESFKNEIALLRGHIHRKDAELQKAQLKIDDLESRLKFDMKKIRIRERELENRLELIRAEKNALTKAKDEQILDLRRKMDVLQMEVDSYRQKCVELNKTLEINQDSFKRTTRALRLAMANLELQEENKTPLKKVD